MKGFEPATFHWQLRRFCDTYKNWALTIYNQVQSVINYVKIPLQSLSFYNVIDLLDGLQKWLLGEKCNYSRWEFWGLTYRPQAGISCINCILLLGRAHIPSWSRGWPKWMIACIFLVGTAGRGQADRVAVFGCQCRGSESSHRRSTSTLGSSLTDAAPSLENDVHCYFTT